MRKIVVLALCAGLLAGCQTTTGMGDRETTGTAGGAVLGGLAGYFIGGRSVGGAVIGALAGGILGNRIGASLDQREQQRVAEASQRAASARTGEQVQWSAVNEQGQTTASGWVMPTSEPVQAANGQTCRQIRQVATKGGQTQQEDVTVCRAQNSDWVMPNA